MTAGIDINPIGYRWRGTYNSGTTYINNDVVQKDGYSQVYYNGVWSNFIPSQQVATVNGSLLTSSGGIYGTDGEVLQVVSGVPDFVPLGDHHGSIAIALPRGSLSGGNRSIANTPPIIMNDNSLRTWGYNALYCLGNGNNTSSRKTPQKPVFPSNVKIASTYFAATACFAIDTTGRLWSWGEDYNYTTGQPAGTAPYSEPRLLNGVGDIPANAVITNVFTNQDYFAYYRQAAIDSNGRVYVWGINNSGCLGVGDTTDRVTPTLLPLSTTVPMKWVGFNNDPYGGGYFISTAGVLYTAGNAYRSLQGGTGDILTPRVLSWLGSKTVKLVHATCSDLHWIEGTQYESAICVVCDDGTLYQAGDNYQSYGMWGTGYTGTMWPDNPLFPYITNTNVSDAYAFGGGYGRSIILKNDGTVWWSGYNGYYIGREYPNADDTATWVQIGNGNLTNVTKLRCMGGLYGTIAAALRSDGKMVCWGYTGGGACGRASFADPLGPDNNVVPSFVLLDKTIIDFEFTGYCYGGNSPCCILMLTNKGEIFMSGYPDSNFMNGDYTNNPTNTPRKIIF